MAIGYEYEDFDYHPWCSDPSRDAAVRAAEDNRTGPLPTLGEVIVLAFGFDKASAQRACDEVKSWPEDVQKDCRLVLGDLLEQGVERLQALVEAWRYGKGLLAARYPDMFPKSVSASSAVEHENKGNDMATKSEMQAADYRAEAIARPFAEAAKCSSTVSETGEGQSGLRTEQVTLEIAHWGEYSAARWDFAYCLRTLYALESVRVVEEDEREVTVGDNEPWQKAILNDAVSIIVDGGDWGRGNSMDHGKLGAAVIWADKEIGRLRARVTVMEEARKRFDTALEEARDASGINDFIVQRDEAFDERDAAIRERDALRAARITQSLTADRFASAVQEADTLRARVDELEARTSTPGEGSCDAQAASGGGVIRDMTEIVRSDADADEKHAALSTLVEAVCPGWVMAQAASGGGEEEPDAWGVVRDGNVESVTHRRFRGDADRVAEQWGETVVPLYRSHPQPRGWLSQDEREIIAGIADDDEYTEEGQDIAKQLLARSSPPEVVAPAFVETHNAFRNQAIRERDRQWLTAIAAAGVAVKETT